jgi:hypothetical protein
MATRLRSRSSRRTIGGRAGAGTGARAEAPARCPAQRISTLLLFTPRRRTTPSSSSDKLHRLCTRFAPGRILCLIASCNASAGSVSGGHTSSNSDSGRDEPPPADGVVIVDADACIASADRWYPGLSNNGGGGCAKADGGGDGAQASKSATGAGAAVLRVFLAAWARVRAASS